jgi:hypothetical protein
VLTRGRNEKCLLREDIKSELDHYQDNNSEQGSEAQDFRNTILSLIKSYQASQQELLK